MTNYIKLAIKVLARRKFFTFISLFGISLTLVVLMIATTMLDNLFASRAPESRFDRVLCVYRVSLHGPEETETMEAGYGFLQQFVKPLKSAENVAVFSNSQSTAIYMNGQRIDTSLKETDGAYWQILDFKFLEGRPFTKADDDSGAMVAVVTSKMAQKLFGGPAIGKTFVLDGRAFRVVGVVPPVSNTRIAAFSDIWVPIGTERSSSFRHEMLGSFNGLVLARDASDFQKIRAEFNKALASFPLDRPRFKEINVYLDTPYQAFARMATPFERNSDGARPAILVTTILIVLALAFMTLPALNLVTLNLSRILERAEEIGVRKAFGASRGALMRQFIIENVILTLIGGVIGFLLTLGGIHALNVSGLINNAYFDVNLRVFALAMLVAIFFGFFSGAYPAWRMARLDPVNALRGGAQ
jgi:putative ABC transport system permease protein